MSTRRRSTAGLPVEIRAERDRLRGEIERIRSSMSGDSPHGLRRLPSPGRRHPSPDPGQPGAAGGGGRPGRGRRRGRAGSRLPPLARRPRGGAAETAGRLDRRPAQSAVRPGHRQPALAGPLRVGPGRDAERLRLQRRPAVASRAARLAGRRDRRPGLEPEGDASPDRHLGDLSPIVAVRSRRPQAGRGRSPPVAEGPDPAGGRDGPRRHARRLGAARPEARRAELPRPRTREGPGDARHALPPGRSRRSPASTAAPSTAPGPAEAGARSSTPSTAPTRRPPRRGGPSRPRRSRPWR